MKMSVLKIILNMLSKVTVFHIGFGAMLAAVVSFIAPVEKFLIISSFLVFTDLISGIMAAKKRNEKITSYGFRRTVVKILLYAFAILCSRGVMIVFAPESMQGYQHFTWVVAGTICLTELTSLFENVEEVTGVPLISRLEWFQNLLNRKS